MMNRCRLLLLSAIVLAGCGEKKPKPGAWVGNDPKVIVTEQPQRKQTTLGRGATPEQMKPVVKPEVPLPRLATLQVDLPVGWKPEFLKDANTWYFDKPVRVSDFGAVQQIRVTAVRSPVETEPATLDAYAKFLREKPDESGFIWPQVVETGNLPDGFYIVGKVRLAVDVTATSLDTGLCVIRTIGGDRLRFKCHKLPDELRFEALELCKSARF